MRLIEPNYEIKWHMGREATLELLEWAGRKCYKSEEKIKPGTASKFVSSLLMRNPPHESVIEHISATVLFIVDRGVSHELVRHRLASYSQESTRFCDYGGDGIVFIIPPWLPRDIIIPGTYNVDCDSWHTIVSTAEAACPGARDWLHAMVDAEDYYQSLRRKGWTPEKARDVLPISLKTEVVSTFNLRQWRHVFKMRTAEKCHPQMREIMIPLLVDFQHELPEIFTKYSS